jgi:phosphatidylinositol alpha-1,6-mannosyltransferase
MAVVIHSFEYPPVDGGISRLCRSIADGFVSSGFRTHVVSQQSEGMPGQPPGCAHRVPFKRPVREISALHWLRSRHRDDLVISGIWYPEGLLTRLAGVKRCVILAHGLELLPGASRFRRSVWTRLGRQTLESAALVVANSRYTAGLVAHAAPRARVITVPLGVDQTFFAPGDKESARRRFGVEEKIVICSVSRLTGYKGHDTVLDALAVLPAHIRERMVYLIAGKGPARAALELRAERLGIGGTIRWLGFVPDHDLPVLYNASDLFVLCTRENASSQEVEGFGLVFLEAQACGTPVVGTNTGGIPDAIQHGCGGWLIPQNDPAALSSWLTRLAEAPQEFRLAGKAARARVERECTWSGYFRRLARALEAHGLLTEKDRAAVPQPV